MFDFKKDAYENLYDNLTPKQQKKFAKKHAFTIEFSEISNFEVLNGEQARALIIAVGYFAGTLKKDFSELPPDVAEQMKNPLLLPYYKAMTQRIAEHTKSYLNNRVRTEIDEDETPETPPSVKPKKAAPPPSNDEITSPDDVIKDAIELIVKQEDIPPFSNYLNEQGYYNIIFDEYCDTLNKDDVVAKINNIYDNEYCEIQRAVLMEMTDEEPF